MSSKLRWKQQLRDCCLVQCEHAYLVIPNSATKGMQHPCNKQPPPSPHPNPQSPSISASHVHTFLSSMSSLFSLCEATHGAEWRAGLNPFQKEPLIRPSQLNYRVSAGSERLSHLSSITTTRHNSEPGIPARKQQRRLGTFQEQ